MFLCCLSVAWRPEPATATSFDELLDLSLEELSSYSITTMSRKAQRVRDVAAAGYVITREDLARSGALTIPEALRMVPGMEVAQISANRWAVSARGLNERFANKLLVLIDGRNIYSPVFSGALWEDQNLILDDIERIEVVRGPGAALWGSNAVNGVINIVTRHARDTDGVLLSARVDDHGGGAVATRVGTQINATDFLRAYAVMESGHAMSPADRTIGEAAGWQARRGGFRYDGLAGGSTIMLSGDVFANREGDLWQIPAPSIQQNPYVRLTEESFGFDTVGRITGRTASGHELSVDAYVNFNRMKTGALQVERTEVAFDAQLRTVFGRHDILWGADYRWFDDSFDTRSPFEVSPAATDYARIGAFIHDEITLIPETLKWIVGTKLEQEERSGFNWQPNTRLIWTPSEAFSVWGAVSRAVRTLSRTESDMIFAVEGSLESSLWVQPVIDNRNRHLSPEKATTWELGFRHEPNTAFRYDIALYHTRYHDMRTVHTDDYVCPAGVTAFPYPGAPSISGCAPDTLTPYVIQNAHLFNHSVIESTGAEISADWQLRPWWRVHLNYTNQRLEAPATDDPIAVFERARLLGSSPRYQIGLRSSMNLAGKQKLDVMVRHVAKLRHEDIPAYTAVDAAYHVSVAPDLELALIGKNLFDDRHVEFKNTIPDMPSEAIERSFHVKVTWRF